MTQTDEVNASAGAAETHPPPTLSRMLTEQALDGATRAIRGDTAAVPGAASAPPPAPPESGRSTPREAAELRNQLLQLRSDVALQGARLRRIALGFGALSLLAIGGAAFWLDARQPRATSTPPLEASPPSHSAAAPADTPVAAPATAPEPVAPPVAAPATATMPPAVASANTEPSASDPAAVTTDDIDCERLIDAGEGGEKVDFSILFGAGSAQLPVGGEGTLAGFAQMLRMLPTSCVLIEGYADASGHSTRNEEVSLARARAVAATLIANGGIEARRVVARGRGSVSTGDAAARDPANRRVVFRLFRQ